MTQPTPQEKARSLAKAIARNEDSLRTIEITKQPTGKAQPIPDDPSPFDDEEDQ